MKVRVLLDYVDKYTYVWHKTNEIVEMTDERYNEINRKRKFVEEIKEKKTRKKAKTINKVNETDIKTTIEEEKEED